MISLLLLVGCPASGKTTLANSLVKAYPNKYIRINQDELDTRIRCENEVLKWIQRIHHSEEDEEDRVIIIDRCNFDSKQRRTWIQIAYTFKMDAHALFLNIDFDECRERVLVRPEHPKDVKGHEGVRILNRFKNDLRAPVTCEGFKSVVEWTQNDLPKLISSTSSNELLTSAGYSKEEIDEISSRLSEQQAQSGPHSPQKCNGGFCFFLMPHRKKEETFVNKWLQRINAV